MKPKPKPKSFGKVRKHILFDQDVAEEMTRKADSDGQSLSVCVNRALRRDFGLER